MNKLFKSLAFCCILITSCQAIAGFAANPNFSGEQFGHVIHQNKEGKAGNSLIQRSYIAILDTSPLLALKGTRSGLNKSTDPSRDPSTAAKIQTQLNQINAQQDGFISSLSAGLPDASIAKRKKLYFHKPNSIIEYNLYLWFANRVILGPPLRKKYVLVFIYL